MGLKAPALDAIQSTCHHEAGKCFRATLKTWLSSRDLHKFRSHLTVSLCESITSWAWVPSRKAIKLSHTIGGPSLQNIFQCVYCTMFFLIDRVYTIIMLYHVMIVSKPACTRYTFSNIVSILPSMMLVYICTDSSIMWYTTGQVSNLNDPLAKHKIHFQTSFCLQLRGL